MKKIIFSLALAASLTVSSFALASEGEDITPQYWPHKGVFGTYDKAALQRGFQIYKEVCSACHAMKFVYYRNLEQLGYTPDQVKAVAAEATITDGPNDDGEMFDRPGRPSDHFKSPFKNDKAARSANGGALPPDMSLLVKARAHNEDYIYAVLTGYGTPPAEVADPATGKMIPFTMNTGMNYNKAFPGHQIAMPQPLTDNRVTYTDGTNATLDQEARDVTQFLAWASEPYQDERKQMGLKAVLFLLAFAAVMYAAKRKVWKDLH